MSQDYNLRRLNLPGDMPDPISCYPLCVGNCLLLGLLREHFSNLPPLSQNPGYTPATATFCPKFGRRVLCVA